VRKYGGGPEINSLQLCTKCQTFIRAYNDRRQAEFDLVSKYDTKDTGEGNYWYLVDALWVNKWKRYVRAERVTDISEVSAPGPITNERLLDKDNPGRPRANLKLRVDYIGVNARVWWLFMHVHGGGPSICREELDMYSVDCQPETDLRLEELHGKGGSEYSRRISWQFVDECQGDLELYKQRHGPLDAEGGDASEVDGREIDDRGGSKRSDQDDDGVQKLSNDVDDLRCQRNSSVQEIEKQIAILKSDIQLTRARQKQLRDAGAVGNAWQVPKERDDKSVDPAASDLEEQLASEVHKEKQLQQRLEQKDRELAERREEELRRS
jgi:uncharacterized small protein (DUF1192 family)